MSFWSTLSKGLKRQAPLLTGVAIGVGGTMLINSLSDASNAVAQSKAEGQAFINDVGGNTLDPENESVTKMTSSAPQPMPAKSQSPLVVIIVVAIAVWFLFFRRG